MSGRRGWGRWCQRMLLRTARLISQEPLSSIGNGEGLTIDPLILCAHRSVNVLAIRAKEFDRIDSRRIHPSTRQDRLTLTKHPGTYPKGILFEPFSLREEEIAAH